MDKHKIIKIIQGYEHLDTDFIALGCAEDIADEILALVNEGIAGVTFSDGEFVPIEDKSIMQWIAEQLGQ